jgi:hypothetical protein
MLRPTTSHDLSRPTLAIARCPERTYRRLGGALGLRSGPHHDGVEIPIASQLNPRIDPGAEAAAIR